MSSGSGAGSQQIYSQGSPYSAGHSGKAFRYGPGRGEGREDIPSLGKPGVLELGSVCDRPWNTSYWNPGRAEDAGGSGAVLHPPCVAVDEVSLNLSWK